MKKTFTLLLTWFISASIIAQPLLRAAPEDVGLDSKKLFQADYIIGESIEKGEIPGAVLAVVKGNKIVYLKAYGNKAIFPAKQPMEVNTIFDLASVSKPLGAGISTMQLIERGKLRLTDEVKMYIPGFRGYIDSVSGKETSIRIIDLLTHSSGLPPYAPVEVLVKKYGSPNPAGLMEYISSCKRDFEPTTKFQYSCLNFITLQFIIEKITGMTLAEYTKKNIYDVLGLKFTGYNPPAELYGMTAPTEVQKDSTVLLGKVHDPLARLMNGGNSGNAGLFSNAEEMAVIAAALMNGGSYRGKRVLGSLTVETMTRIPAGLESFGRSLGWDNSSAYASNLGNLFHPGVTYGHTGYTGTSIVIDPAAKMAVILLTNRVHPYDKGSVTRLRALVANVVAGSVM